MNDSIAILATAGVQGISVKECQRKHIYIKKYMTQILLIGKLMDSSDLTKLHK